jgi:hypothetical protein
MRNVLSLAYLTVDGADPIEHIEAAADRRLSMPPALRIVPPSHLKVDYGIVGHPERIRAIKRALERNGRARPRHRDLHLERRDGRRTLPAGARDLGRARRVLRAVGQRGSGSAAGCGPLCGSCAMRPRDSVCGSRSSSCAFGTSRPSKPQQRS